RALSQLRAPERPAYCYEVRKARRSAAKGSRRPSPRKPVSYRQESQHVESYQGSAAKPVRDREPRIAKTRPPQLTPERQKWSRVRRVRWLRLFPPLHSHIRVRPDRHSRCHTTLAEYLLQGSRSA